MVEEYPFPADPRNQLDLFPDIILNGLCAFHGTSEIYCRNIDKRGFRRKWMPVSKRKFKLLIEYLASLGMGDQIDGHASVKNRLNDYLKRRATAPLCFTYTAYESLFYAIDTRKGGQIFTAVNEAIKFIEEQYELRKEYLKLILFKIRFYRLKKLLSKVQESRGCIYVVSFTEADLDKLNNTGIPNPHSKGRMRGIHSYIERINPPLIIGKMFIDATARENEEIYQQAVTESIKKTSQRGHLAHTLTERATRPE